MIIALPHSHPATSQLEHLAKEVREACRSGAGAGGSPLASALNLTEISHGNHTTTYHIQKGTASAEEAIFTYQYVRKHHPAVLDILCMGAAGNASEILVEIGSLAPKGGAEYSSHDMFKIMPRILAQFRGATPVGNH